MLALCGAALIVLGPSVAGVTLLVHLVLRGPDARPTRCKSVLGPRGWFALGSVTLMVLGFFVAGVLDRSLGAHLSKTGIVALVMLIVLGRVRRRKTVR